MATDIGVDAAKTGMLASAEIMVADRRGRRRGWRSRRSWSTRSPPRSTATRCCGRTRSPRCATTIIPLADLVTPNLGEVRLLTGLEVDGGRADARRRPRAARPGAAAGCWSRAATCPAATRSTCSTTATTSSSSAGRGTRPTHTHGSGDTLAAAITAGLARGLDVPDAVREGKAFIAGAVAGSFPLGAGLGPVGHFWRVRDWPLP